MKSLVRRGAISDLCRELNANIVSSPRPEKQGDGNDNSNVSRDQLRQIAKIWTALSKLVRSQCNKGRIIDSLYFGSFGKSSTISEDGSKTYTYCPGPKSLFKLIENAENVQQVP